MPAIFYVNFKLRRFARHCRIVFPGLFWVLFTACALIPPVQEMSNARQTVQAAKAAGAETHDSKRFLRAKQLLDEASQLIEQGDYLSARKLAIEARTLALKARQQSLLKQ